MTQHSCVQQNSEEEEEPSDISLLDDVPIVRRAEIIRDQKRQKIDGNNDGSSNNPADSEME